MRLLDPAGLTHWMPTDVTSVPALAAVSWMIGHGRAAPGKIGRHARRNDALGRSSLAASAVPSDRAEIVRALHTSSLLPERRTAPARLRRSGNEGAGGESLPDVQSADEVQYRGAGEGGQHQHDASVRNLGVGTFNDLRPPGEKQQDKHEREKTGEDIGVHSANLRPSGQLDRNVCRNTPHATLQGGAELFSAASHR